jgi:hypothetical protein
MEQHRSHKNHCAIISLFNTLHKYHRSNNYIRNPGKMSGFPALQLAIEFVSKFSLQFVIQFVSKFSSRLALQFFSKFSLKFAMPFALPFSLKFVLHFALLFVLPFVSSMRLYGQCPTNAQINEQVEISEKENTADTKKRIKNLYEYKQRIDDCKLLKDSVYAKILHKIGILEYQANNYVPTEKSFTFTAEAIRINTSGIKTASPSYATKSFSNLAVLYSAANLNREAVRYCDSTIKYTERYPAYISFLRVARNLKALALFETGDYQGSIDESSLGIRDALNSSDSLQAATLFVKRAQAYQLQGNNIQARKDVSWTIDWVESVLKTRKKEQRTNPDDFINYYQQLANAYKIKALSIDVAKPTNDATNLLTGVAYPKTDAATPTTDAAKPTNGAFKPTTDATKPTTGTTKPNLGAARHTTDAVKPTTSTDNPTTELADLIKLSNQYLLKVGDSTQLSNNYNDFGAHYFTAYRDYKKAKENYIQSMKFGKSSRWNLAFGYLNLGAADFPVGDYASAEKNYLKMLALVNLPAKSILDNQQVAQLMAIPYKQLVHVFLNNKTELLLGLYKKTNDAKYLKACLATALTTDSVIQEMRREQTTERSKLFWRNRTRNFFTNALEACYLAKDYSLAFYLTEKSRAVILTDKLNELGASSLLPADETVRGQLLRKAIADEEQTLRSLSPASAEYDSVTLKLIQARQDLNNHIVSLEKKYPDYYKYKFSNDILSYDEFKAYLAGKKSSYVSYFLGDSVSFILYVSPDIPPGGLTAPTSGLTGTKDKLIKVPAASYNKNQLDSLLTFFADGARQNSQYGALIKQCNEFYKRMFAPAGIAKGNLIVCPDGFILPFDALYSDGSGNKTLLDDYSISYAYSANSLFTKRTPAVASKNFGGFAPVSFKPYLKLVDLIPSADFLDEAASNYSSTKIFTRQESSRKNFLSNLGSYRIVNVFSHAGAGNGNEEPILYMEDSVIYLSELQDIGQVKTQLVILSACETSAGKNAIGEGIYSLSRGFAAAGIPSVMATIWRADEHPVYRISVLFHKYIAGGMRKDDALRQAKTDYLKTANKERRLPYYWANMVIMGNTDPVKLVQQNFWPWVFASIGLLSLVIGIGVWNRNHKRQKLQGTKQL